MRWTLKHRHFVPSCKPNTVRSRSRAVAAASRGSRTSRFIGPGHCAAAASLHSSIPVAHRRKARCSVPLFPASRRAVAGDRARPVAADRRAYHVARGRLALSARLIRLGKDLRSSSNGRRRTEGAGAGAGSATRNGGLHRGLDGSGALCSALQPMQRRRGGADGSGRRQLVAHDPHEPAVAQLLLRRVTGPCRHGAPEEP